MTISHHLAHAYSAFAVSPYEEGAIMIVDGVGSYRVRRHRAVSRKRHRDAAGARVGELLQILGTKLECLKKVWMEPDRGFLSDEFYNMPGLGALYSRASTYIFGDWNKCGELMGLAPYGRRENVKPLMRAQGRRARRAALDRRTQSTLRDGRRPEMGEQPVDEALGGSGLARPGRHRKSAARRAAWLRETTGAKNLCIAGGVALNCVANGRIAREAGFPECVDSAGCRRRRHRHRLRLLWLARSPEAPRSFVMKHSYVGKTLFRRGSRQGAEQIPGQHPDDANEKQRHRARTPQSCSPIRK